MQQTFENWAQIIAKRTCIVFWASLVFFVGLSLGLAKSEIYEDENIIWTPEGNPSLVNRDKSEILFPVEEKFQNVNVIFTAKSGGSLLTPEALAEIARFEEAVLYSVKEYDDTRLDRVLDRPEKGKLFTFEEVCLLEYFTKSNGDSYSRCYNSPSILNFFYDVDSETYDFAGLTAEDVVAKIQTGKGDPLVYKDEKIIFLEGAFGGMTPNPVIQEIESGNDDPIGSNNVEAAEAMQVQWLIQEARNPEIDSEAYFGLEEKMTDKFESYRRTLKHVDAEMFHIYGFFESVKADIDNDFGLIFTAIFLVILYVILFLGTFSPMHCRCIVSLAGLLCVIFCYTSGFGFMSLCGARTTGVHQLMPFLLIGIGADDMFVMCNALDQTDLKKSAEERLIEALGHAGPAITITSLTNSLAFAFGATTSLIALKSFCGFAAVCIFMLYLASITLFTAVLYWDSYRVEKKKGECCGLCMCDEETIFCCFGACSSLKQKEYCGVELSEEKVKAMKEEEEKADPAIKTVLKASRMERCIGKYFAPYVLSTVGRIIFLVIYAVMIGGAIYGATQVRIHFEIDYFISKESSIYEWFNLSKQYYDRGGIPTTTFVEGDIDWSTEENQEKIMALNTALEDCTGCQKNWHVPNSILSWYRLYNNWVNFGNCEVYSKVSPSETHIPKQFFYPCFREWISLSDNTEIRRYIAYNEDRTIKGWRQLIEPISFDTISADGPQYLEDIRRIEDNFGLGDTYSYSELMLDFEQYVVFFKETAISVCLSIMAVFIVVLLITGSLPVTLLVVFAVVLVDLFLIALIHYWDLTLNNIIVVNLVIGLGLAVDYSAHIAHTYLVVKAPSGFSKQEQRLYKSRVALSSMGSSVVHGGISTFLAVLVLSMAKSYIFVVFFKLWFGIVVFGMSNGFILLPIILSLVGPTPDLEKQTQEFERRLSRRLSLKPGQLAELQKVADSEAGKSTPAAKGPTNQSEIEMDSGPNASQKSLNPQSAKPGE